MAIEYKIPITTVSGGSIVPVTTGYYALRVSPYSTNTHSGSHVANGVWDFGAVADGTYQLYYSADNWVTESKVDNFGTRYIGTASPTFDTAIASTKVETDTISEKTSGSGVTIDGLLIKDGGISLDTLSEKTSGAGVTIDGVLLKDNAVTCSGSSSFTGGCAFTSVAPTTAVTPSTGNDIVNKTYADALVPFKYWYGRFTGDASNPTLTKLAGNLGGEITVTRTAEGTYSLNCSALFTSAKTHITDGVITDGSTQTVETLYDNVSTSLITLYCYNNANALNDKAIVDIEIKVFS